MTVISDERRSALWSSNLSTRIWKLAASDQTGIRHIYASQTVTRPALAEYLLDGLGIEAVLDVAPRCRQRFPHLGDVDLRSQYGDPLARPLPAVTSGLPVDLDCEGPLQSRSGRQR